MVDLWDTYFQLQLAKKIRNCINLKTVFIQDLVLFGELTLGLISQSKEIIWQWRHWIHKYISVSEKGQKAPSNVNLSLATMRLLFQGLGNRQDCWFCASSILIWGLRGKNVVPKKVHGVSYLGETSHSMEFFKGSCREIYALWYLAMFIYLSQ